MGRPKKQHTDRVWGTRAVIYLRVSGEKQVREGHGLEAQEDACVGYAERRGYTVVGVKRDEAISGAKGQDERAGLDEALYMCLTGYADVFLCGAIDRQARDVILFNQVRAQLKKAGVRFETAKEGQDFTQDSNMLMGDIYAAFAAEERRTIASRLYGGRRQRSKVDGLGSGPIVWGYVRSADGAINVDSEAQETIRFVLDERDKGTTYQRVADMLRERGYTKQSGGTDWNVGNVQTIEKHAELYKTGKRTWDGVTATEPWPVVV